MDERRQGVWKDSQKRKGGDLIACATAMGVAAVNAVRAATVATMASAGASKTIAEVSQLVHERCGHLGLPYQKLMTGLNHLPFCKACALSKAVRKARNKGRRTVPKLPFEKVHVDIAGPFVESDSGYKYAISFTCGLTQYTHVYFLRRKSEALGALLNYISDTWIRFKMPISTLQLDNAGEFGGGLNNEAEEIQPDFRLFCKAVGIQLNFSPTQAANRKMERLNASGEPSKMEHEST